MEINFLSLSGYLLNVAHNKRESAGYSGRMDDDGAKSLEDQIECFRAGLDNRVPECWTHYVSDFKKISDPEYSEYMRLKKKFD